MTEPNTLHLVGGEHGTDNFRDCLGALSRGDIVLLTGDAVYLAADAHRHEQLADIPFAVRVLALAADLEQRGMTRLAEPFMEIIDDHEFVRLAAACRRSVSWF